VAKERREGEVPRSWWISILLTFAVLLSLQSITQLVRAAREESLAEGATPPAVLEKDGLRIEARADRSKVSIPGVVHVWVTFQNRSDAEIQNLKLGRFRTDGFKQGRCWIAEVPACRPGETVAKSSLLPAKLLPGETVALMGDLQPENAPGSRVLMGPVSWTLVRPGKSPLNEVEVVTLGPLQVAEPPTHWLLTVGEAVYSFFKDLGVPVVLGLLAYLFQRLQQDRTRQQETRQRFLDRATDNSARFYLPICSAAHMLVWQSRAFKEAAPGDPEREKSFRRSFYYFLYLMKKNRDLGHHAGGFFFPKREAEKVVDKCERAFFPAAWGRLGYIEISEVLDSLDEEETITSLEKKLFRPRFLSLLSGSEATAATRLRDGFRTWLEKDGFDRYHDVLTVFSKVVLYEVNTVYASWYGQEDQPREDLEEIWRGLKPEDAEIATALRSYLDRLGKRPRARIFSSLGWPR